MEDFPSQLVQATVVAALLMGRASMPFVVACLAVPFALRGMASKLTGPKAWGAMERRGFQLTSTGSA